MYRLAHYEAGRTTRTNATVTLLALLAGLVLALHSGYKAPPAAATIDCNIGEVDNVTPPTITPTGNVANSMVLSMVSHGSWSVCGGGTITSYNYQWVHDDAATPIPGKTSTSYTVSQTTDVAHLIELSVQACDSVGDCSDYVASSNWAALGFYPTKAVDFPCFQTTYNNQNRTDIVNELAAAHVRQVRIVAPWLSIETNNGVYSSTALSRLYTCISDITTANTTPKMSVIVSVFDTPSWAQTAYPSQDRVKTVPPSDCLSSTASCASISNFMATLTNDLFGQGYAWSQFSYEIWNEANNRTFWTPACNNGSGWHKCSEGPPPETNYNSNAHHQYVYLTTAAYNAVKQCSLTNCLTGHPDAVTVATGGALANWSTVNYITMTAWNSYIYSDWCGGSGSTCRDTNPPPWDVIALHPYPNQSSGGCPYVSTAFTYVPTVATTMSAYGDSRLPIWFTEYGWADDHLGTYCSDLNQGSRLTDALTYPNVPDTVRDEVWWVSDEKFIDNSSCTSFYCYTYILNWDSGTDTFGEESIYSYLQSAPQ